MKRSTLASLSAVGALVVALAPGVSHAQWDGQVKFVGKVSDVTCLINGNAPGMNNILEVPMGEHAPSDFTGIGVKTSPVSFDINLTAGSGAACSSSATARVAFDNDSVHVDKSSGNLKISSSAPAQGVQIEINDAGNSRSGKIHLGAAQQNPQEVVLTAAGGTLYYTANYVSTAAAVLPGTANSIIPFMVAYE
ncbi:major type 1 subunit fimbrin (pilin) [Achromobacter deleyi]|uniref:fimbrial protein n=1 Tax=Achromobacter TaxID=222 RepID=UPI001304A132|nr:MULTISPECIES: fimbrial protein [Achromobacter]MDR6600172.1 major type 1 subunit fimbrin (pilin) [Achromobacter deleyi]